MKFVYTLFLLAFIAGKSIAQVTFTRVHRSINFRTFGKDSVNLSFNDAYFLIEDSCAQIIRYGHYNFQNRSFTGSFKDESKATPGLVVSEGNYTANGLKDGLFTAHYLNGNLQAKGNFKNNKYDGRWELYYDNGKPQLTFEVANNNCKIIDAWKPDGTKTVDNGNGTYISNADGYYWTGKLVDGKPDGTWKFINADDATSRAVITESYKKGQFHKGTAPMGDYADSSRISLVSPDLLPFINAEKMMISKTSCDGTGFKHIVGAQYKYGLDAYTDEIRHCLARAFMRVNLADLSGTLLIEGKVTEGGALSELHPTQQSAQQIAHKIIMELEGLPLLQPATLDKKPIKQGFRIFFSFQSATYSFNYNFLPIAQQ